MRRGAQEPRRPDGLAGAERGASPAAHRSILRQAPAQDPQTRCVPKVRACPTDHGSGGASDRRGRGGDPPHHGTDEPRRHKIKSGLFGNTEELPSEIPCRVSSDLHEWCNDWSTVSEKDSAKL